MSKQEIFKSAYDATIFCFECEMAEQNDRPYNKADYDYAVAKSKLFDEIINDRKWDAEYNAYFVRRVKNL